MERKTGTWCGEERRPREGWLGEDVSLEVSGEVKKEDGRTVKKDEEGPGEGWGRVISYLSQTEVMT